MLNSPGISVRIAISHPFASVPVTMTRRIDTPSTKDPAENHFSVEWKNLIHQNSSDRSGNQHDHIRSDDLEISCRCL